MSENRAWGPYNPLDDDTDKIVDDCLHGYYEDAALRFKRIVINCKSTFMNREQFKVVANTIDMELRAHLTGFQYSSWCLAIAKVQSATLSFNDKKLDRTPLQ